MPLPEQRDVQCARRLYVSKVSQERYQSFAENS